MGNGHIVKSFAQELQRLSNLIARMGGVAEAQVESAVRAVARRDAPLARQVVETDPQVDDYERAIDAETLRLLALRQPMAGDLREILAALKIAGHLERIGDYASNIGKRATVLADLPAVRPADGIAPMGGLALAAMKDVLDAYLERDVEKALAVLRRDEELDALYSSLFAEILAHMAEDSRSVTPCAHLLFIAKGLERIGDHATNIAEIVHFLVKGHAPAGKRPKGDTSSSTVLSPEGPSR